MANNMLQSLLFSGGGGGGGGGALIVNIVYPEIEGNLAHLDKTAGEIMTAFQSGIVLVNDSDDPAGNNVNLCMIQYGRRTNNPFTQKLSYNFWWWSSDGSERISVTAEGANAYPSFQHI